MAQLLASWLHVRGEDWPDRVRSWLPAGCDAWVVQREVADPALHVGTWQRDGGLDPASPAGREQARAWLDWMDGAGVEAVGFGLLTLRRTDGAPTVVFEDLREPFDDPLGPEVEGWLDRVDWLRAHADDAALLSARLTLAPSVLAGALVGAGRRGLDGGGRRGRASGRAAVAPRGGRPGRGPAGGLPRARWPLGELVELLAIAHDRPTDALVAATLPAVREFVRHGLLVPSAEAG